jgi:hypothetical protein
MITACGAFIGTIAPQLLENHSLFNPAKSEWVIFAENNLQPEISIVGRFG